MHILTISLISSKASISMATAPAHAPPPPAPTRPTAPVLLSTPHFWTFSDLITQVLTSGDNTITWLMNKGLLACSIDCPKCQSSCRMGKKNGSPIWRCPRKGCQTKVSKQIFWSYQALLLNHLKAYAPLKSE